MSKQIAYAVMYEGKLAKLVEFKLQAKENETQELRVVVVRRNVNTVKSSCGNDI